MEERPIPVAMRVTLVVRGAVWWVTKKTAGKPRNGGKTVDGDEDKIGIGFIRRCWHVILDRKSRNIYLIRRSRRCSC